MKKKEKNPLDRIVTMDDVRKFNPCYLGVYAPEGWSMRLSEILKLKACPAPNRIMQVLRFLPKENCVDFAWRCAFFAAARAASAAAAARDAAASAAREASDVWDTADAWEALTASATSEAAAARAASDALDAWAASDAAAALAESAVSDALTVSAVSDASDAWATWEVSDAREHERQMQIEYLLEILS